MLKAGSEPSSAHPKPLPCHLKSAVLNPKFSGLSLNSGVPFVKATAPSQLISPTDAHPEPNAQRLAAEYIDARYMIRSIVALVILVVLALALKFLAVLPLDEQL